MSYSALNLKGINFMKEYIVTGTCNGRRAMVRVFAYNPSGASLKARMEHGFSSTLNTKLA